MKSCLVTCILFAIVTVTAAEPIAEPVALRVESFTVAPSSQPLAYVVMKNLRNVPYQGTLALAVPEGWRLAPSQHDVTLEAGQTERWAFDVERGISREANRYPVTVTAVGGGATVSREQDVVCASAPYFKPTIDGDPSDWDDAIPVTFVTGGKNMTASKKTVVRTFWNSRRFSLLIEVEEDRMTGLPENEKNEKSATPCDAVQLAIAPGGTTTGTSPDDRAVRYEFLAVASAVSSSGSATGRCFQLAAPGMTLAETQAPRPLAPLEYTDAEVAVRRQGTTTYYEISLPFRPMRDHIRPSEGRVFCLSVLVHDPDGTGIRDWGRAAGLWPDQRNRWAWSRWQGDDWGDEIPFDNKLPWGLCSSKY